MVAHAAGMLSLSKDMPRPAFYGTLRLTVTTELSLSLHAPVLPTTQRLTHAMAGMPVLERSSACWQPLMTTLNLPFAHSTW